MKKAAAFLAAVLMISMLATTALAQSRLLSDFEKTDENLLVWANQSGKSAGDCVIQSKTAKAKIALEKTNPISGKASLSIAMADGVATERILASPFGSTDWSGKSYLGMRVKNTNETDVYMYLSIQQYNDQDKESWTLSSHSEDVIVVNKDGTEDKFYTIDATYGFLIEADFEGNVYFPLYPEDVEYSPAAGEVYKKVGAVQMFFNVIPGQMADQPLYFDDVGLYNKEEIKINSSEKPTATTPAKTTPAVTTPVVTTTEPGQTTATQTTPAASVTPTVSPTATQDSSNNPGKRSNFWVWLIIAAIVIAAGAAAAVIIKKKKASSQK